MALPRGARLGPYEVLGPLGAGGMGEVYRARDTRLGRESALKVLPDEVSADRQRLARLQQEARMASSLSHPNIITIHDVGESGGTSFIVMELAEGRTLRTLLASGPFATRQLLEVGVQVADGRGPRGGHGASRPEARERDADGRRRGEDPRLRARQA